MSTRKPPESLQTIPEFLATHPQFTDHQVRYALRNRIYNGLAKYTYRRATGRREVLIDAAAYAGYLTAVIPA